ncbi:MAG: excinuclease ABC subunit UvrA [Bacteroidia bacterium]
MADNKQLPIEIKGAREHNLKNIDVLIPRNKLTVVTGVSGSGKSTLVFDTLYAEGQRRYVESLSAYARQFMGKMHKPDVDFINGISPAIAIEQKVNIKNPRSTVATQTEIYDYLKLLFARVGVTFSPLSGNIVKRHTVEDVVDFIKKLPNASKVYLLVKIDLAEPNQLKKSLEVYLQNGFSRLMINNEIVEIEDYLLLKAKQKKETVFLLIDRFISQTNDEDFDTRVADSVQTAFYEGHGELSIFINHDNISETHTFNNKFEIDGISFEEPTVNFFSFNNPYGACPKCEGFGSVIGIDEDLVIPNKSLSIFEDAVAPWKGEKMQDWKAYFINLSKHEKFPIHKPYFQLTEQQKDYLWQGGTKWEGINGFFAEIEKQTYKIQNRVMLARYRGKTTCPDCKGTRLRKDTNYVRLVDVSINAKNYTEYKCLSEILLMNVSSCLQYFNNLKLSENHQKIADRILHEITSRLDFLNKVGLGYLSLSRLSNTLSGGESQRINLATNLGSSLVGSLYILDEPSIGLHSRDTENLIKVLKTLRDIGNTVVVVEHDQDVMEQADFIIDIGPYAGTNGGNIVATGKVDDIKSNLNSLTGKYLTGNMQIEVPKKRRVFNNKIIIKGARQHNLKNINVTIPLNTLVVVTGVSGSGKTTLIKSIFYPALQKLIGDYAQEKTGSFDCLEGDIKLISQVEMIDQNPIGKSSRSNPVTYVKAYDGIRELFANQPISKNRGYRPQHFSFNVDGGRCETCQGEGEIRVEMQFMADIVLPCEDCNGKRFKEEILEVQYKNKNVSDVLNLTVDEAIDFFKDERSIRDKLLPLQSVGLGYVQLGQSSNTLSGGEAQRVKLASFLTKGKALNPILFIFDEPTTGLHFNDINKLMNSFNAILNNGHSIVVIEHNMDVIKCADWIIDLGPDAGENGGHLVFEGLPEKLIEVKESYTAKYLKEKLNV